LAIFNRLPNLKQIAPVYAVCVIVIYSWTTLWFFWKLPSWLFYMNAGEIALVYAYLLVTNFLESLLAVCVPIVLGFILPPKWFRDSFVSRGTSLVLLGLGYFMFLAYQFQAKDDYPSVLLKARSVTLALGIIALLVILIAKIPFLNKAFGFIAERVTIFLYVYIPLSLVSLVVVLPRLLFG